MTSDSLEAALRAVPPVRWARTVTRDYGATEVSCGEGPNYAGYAAAAREWIRQRIPPVGGAWMNADHALAEVRRVLGL